jgi:hypothetical protein
METDFKKVLIKFIEDKIKETHHQQNVVEDHHSAKIQFYNIGYRYACDDIIHAIKHGGLNVGSEPEQIP